MKIITGKRWPIIAALVIAASTALASGWISGRSDDLFNSTTGRWVGKIDRNGKERLVPTFDDPGTGLLNPDGSAFALSIGSVTLANVTDMAANARTFNAAANYAAMNALLGTQGFTSPKLITSVLDSNGNALWTLTATASAVNGVTFANAATGNAPTWTASGTDSNISLNFVPKGTGTVQYNGTEIGFRTIPQNSKSAAYTTVLADSAKHLYHPATDATARIFTIDSNANVPYPIGTAITFINRTGAGALTISITSDTLDSSLGGGSRTCSAFCELTAIKVESTVWVISGPGMS